MGVNRSSKETDSRPALPTTFCNRLREQLPESEATKLCEALEDEAPVSIRLNPYKTTPRADLQSVPWCRYGAYLDRRPQFTLDPLFHAGAYYVQEAGSMFIETLFRQAVGEGEAPMRILDLCAAPGGKTTLLSTLVGAEGLVVANEIVRSRAVVLADNATKWGVGNIAVTNNDPSHFTPFEHFFDLILVDAPCSGEGMFRKDHLSRTQWSEANVKLCTARSRKIVDDIWSSLKPGGILLYSTCTFNREENEQTVEWMCEEFDCEAVEITVDPKWGIEQSRTGSNGINTFRFYPHKLQSEGFFAAVLRKADSRVRTKIPKGRKTLFTDLSRKEIGTLSSWVNQPELMTFSAISRRIYGYYQPTAVAVRQLAESLNMIHSGICMGELFGDTLKPDHSLALFHDTAKNAAPSVDTDLETALNFLRKQEIDPTLFSEGLNRVCFENLPIGWVKRIGNRTNNMLPKELRIMNL